MLTKAEEAPNVTVHFDHKLLQADLENKTLTINDKGTGQRVVQTDFIFGCDGAHSTVRRQSCAGGDSTISKST